tara:strand:+ start:355 stop:774 length:420 start_codon:yes stop_codon:yes gene_type:complete
MKKKKNVEIEEKTQRRDKTNSRSYIANMDYQIRLTNISNVDSVAILSSFPRSQDSITAAQVEGVGEDEFQGSKAAGSDAIVIFVSVCAAIGSVALLTSEIGLHDCVVLIPGYRGIHGVCDEVGEVRVVEGDVIPTVTTF